MRRAAPFPERTWHATKEEGLRNSSPDFRPRFEQVLGWLPFPARFPLFRSLAVDGRGRYWLQAYTPRWAASAAWTVYAAGGRRLGALCAPASFRIAKASDTSLLGTVVDDDDLVHAVMLPLPESRSRR